MLLPYIYLRSRCKTRCGEKTRSSATDSFQLAVDSCFAISYRPLLPSVVYMQSTTSFWPVYKPEERMGG